MKRSSRRARTDDEQFYSQLAALFTEDQTRFQAFMDRILPEGWLMSQPHIQNVINELAKYILQFSRSEQHSAIDLLTLHTRITRVCEDVVCAAYKAGRAADFPLSLATADVIPWIDKSACRPGETDCMQGIVPSSQIVMQALACKYLPNALLFSPLVSGDLSAFNSPDSQMAVVQAVALAIYAGQASAILEPQFTRDTFVGRLRDQQQMGRGLIQASSGHQDEFIKHSVAAIHKYETGAQ